jgi:DNA repair exonuclease SbcCD ATPase subunit
MKKRMLLVAVMLLSLLAAVAQQKSAGDTMAIHTRADAVLAMDQLQSDLAQLNTSHQNYREAAEKLATLYSSLSKRTEAVATAARALKPDHVDPKALSQLLTATSQLEEMQQSFNMQYLALQESMQDEARRFTLLSNIMKTKHDTVKNSISNMR